MSYQEEKDELLRRPCASSSRPSPKRRTCDRTVAVRHRNRNRHVVEFVCRRAVRTSHASAGPSRVGPRHGQGCRGARVGPAMRAAGGTRVNRGRPGAWTAAAAVTVPGSASTHPRAPDSRGRPAGRPRRARMRLCVLAWLLHQAEPHRAVRIRHGHPLMWLIWQHFFGQGYERIGPASLNPAGVMQPSVECSLQSLHRFTQSKSSVLSRSSDGNARPRTSSRSSALFVDSTTASSQGLPGREADLSIPKAESSASTSPLQSSGPPSPWKASMAASGNAAFEKAVSTGRAAVEGPCRDALRRRRPDGAAAAFRRAARARAREAVLPHDPAYPAPGGGDAGPLEGDLRPPGAAPAARRLEGAGRVGPDRVGRLRARRMRGHPAVRGAGRARDPALRRCRAAAGVGRHRRRFRANTSAACFSASASVLRRAFPRSSSMRRFCSGVRLSAAAVGPHACTRRIRRSSVDLPRSCSRIASARGLPKSTGATIRLLSSSANRLGCFGSRMGPPLLEGPSDSHRAVQISIATSATSATSHRHRHDLVAAPRRARGMGTRLLPRLACTCAEHRAARRRQRDLRGG